MIFLSTDRTIYFHFLGKHDALQQKVSLSTAFSLWFKENFAKGKNTSSNFLQRQPPVSAKRERLRAKEAFRSVPRALQELHCKRQT
jgi:hypothetical protein